MDLCRSAKSISKEIENFLAHVNNVKEESITDYLMWKWQENDPRFKYLKAKSYTRHEESKNGRDFTLSIYILTNKTAIPLHFQAKKIDGRSSGFRKSLDYKNQIDKLIKYSSKKPEPALPFYIFYDNGNTRSGARKLKPGIYIRCAFDVQKMLADTTQKKMISREDVLKNSFSFYKLFCCSNYKENNFSSKFNSEKQIFFSEIFDSKDMEQNKERIEKLFELQSYVGIYDCREDKDLK